jgi:hypothetical protein
MNQSRPSNPSLILSLSLTLTLISGASHAAPATPIEPACESILKAIETRISQPSWKSETIINGETQIANMKVRGKFYNGRDGRWAPQSANLDDQERQFIAQVREGVITISKCEEKGEEKIDGIDTTIISMTLQTEGKQAINATVSIGKNGLPYAQSSEHTKTAYRYKNLFPPKLSK